MVAEVLLLVKLLLLRVLGVELGLGMGPWRVWLFESVFVWLLGLVSVCCLVRLLVLRV